MREELFELKQEVMGNDFINKNLSETIRLL